MKPFDNGGSTVRGYVTLFLLGVGAIALHVGLTSKPFVQISRGKYGFGDVILFFGMFAVLALVPACAALFYFRSYRHFWTVLMAMGLALVVAVAGSLLFLFGVL